MQSNKEARGTTNKYTATIKRLKWDIKGVQTNHTRKNNHKETQNDYRVPQNKYKVLKNNYKQ